MPIIRGQDRQRLLPLAVCSALRALIDDEGLDPSARRIELRRILYALQTAYGFVRDGDPANAVDVAQELAEQDGEGQDY